MEVDPQVQQLASAVRGIIFDVDGILTDGRIIYTDDGHELKQFHVRDGASIKLLQQHDIAIAFVTGRRSPMVARRARELGIKFVQQGADSKAAAVQALIAEGFPAQGNAAVGDDLQDLPVFQHDSVGLCVSVPDAHPAALQAAHFVTSRHGGNGVVVEIAELILTAQGKWVF
jgi:3-deoxy-D-manno-octulosonate 8-phosphate phosphatase (KDO 8-P phosphatase)